MADDEWTWPDLDDDLDERLIELADGPGGLGDPLFGDEPGAPEPVARATTPVVAPSPGRAPDAPVRIDADAAADVPAAGTNRSRDEREAARSATSDPAAAPPAGAAGAAAPAGPTAPVPGAWASATSLHPNPEHTMIAKYVAPRPKFPPPIDAATLAGPALLVGTGDPAGQILELAGEQTSWIVGSGEDCDLQIRHEGVSTRHAVISREGSKWRLGDELSVNGTWVNGKRVNVGYVGDGDDLRFGPVECRLAIPAGRRRPDRSAPTGAGGTAHRAAARRLPTGRLATLGIAVLGLAVVGFAIVFLRH